MNDSSITFSPRGEKSLLEEGNVFMPKFDSETGLIPCIAQDAHSGEILMFAFMNELSLKKSIETGEAHYFSRSRNKLWKKGEQSGHTQRIVELKTDCDQDVVLIRVDTRGAAACHVGYNSCFFRKITALGETPDLTLLTDPSGKQFDPNEVYGKK